MGPSPKYQVNINKMLEDLSNGYTLPQEQISDAVFLMADLADRARQIDDPVMNNIMLRLGLFGKGNRPLTEALDEQAQRLKPEMVKKVL